MQSEQAAGKPCEHARASLARRSGPSPVCLVSLVHLVDLVCFVYLVDLVHLVRFVQPKNQTSQTNQTTVFYMLADFFIIPQRPISSVEEGATAPLPRWPAQHHSCREGPPS